MNKFSFLAVFLVCTSAHATADFCNVAGHYTGAYNGNIDGGTLVAMVDPDDGTLRGTAISADGRRSSFGGVIAAGGNFSSGAAATGARFVGRFWQGSDGGTYGRGDWVLVGGQGGTWEVVRDATTNSCQ
ncbi:hypothetical protein CIW54_22980 [Paraburkholderia sp. T12-10]|nr:hypothetical protein CIW54_22980 [Paraburkholderia sp. T12-10]